MVTFLRYGLLLWLLTIIQSSQAQSLTDTSKRLSPEAFLQIVKQYHPIVKQADIGIQKAAAALTEARGGFDPSFYISSDQKTFGGTSYYQQTNPELKIPTWYGIEVKAGLENNSGKYLNNEITPGKTSYIGVSVPLAKNLLMDKRRATLQQAKIFQQQSRADRALQINDLLYDAQVAYLEWAKEYQVYQLINQTVLVNERRLSLIKIAYRQGDRPAIDTTEAWAQLLQFQLQQNEAMVRFNNAGTELSNYLWTAGGIAYDLTPDVIPQINFTPAIVDTLALPVLENLLLTASLAHPALQLYQFKQQQLEIDRKLKFQSLLPTVNVKANLLNKGYYVFKGADAAFFDNNQKFGIDIGIPLRLSEGRGGYKMAKLKLRENNLMQQQKLQQITVKVKQYYQQLSGFQQQVKLYATTANQFQTLLRGEETKFLGGESSLFLLNSRENKVLEANVKLIELVAKYYKSRTAVVWATGQLN